MLFHFITSILNCYENFSDYLSFFLTFDLFTIFTMNTQTLKIITWLLKFSMLSQKLWIYSLEFFFVWNTPWYNPRSIPVKCFMAVKAPRNLKIYFLSQLCSEHLKNLEPPSTRYVVKNLEFRHALLNFINNANWWVFLSDLLDFLGCSSNFYTVWLD